MKNTRATDRGFTLIEAVLTVAIVAVLLVLSIVSLRPARSAALATQCLANGRTNAIGLTIYSGDHSDSFAYFAEHRRLRHAFTNGGFSIDYFGQSFHWPIVALQYISATPMLVEARCPGDPILREDPLLFLSQYPPDYVQPSGYWAAYGTHSDPAWWTEGPIRQTGEPPTSVLRAVRTSEVLYPSDKGFLIERWAYHASLQDVAPFTSVSLSTQNLNSDVRFTVVAVDGSGRLVARSHIASGFRNGPPVLQTTLGIRGRDFIAR